MGVTRRFHPPLFRHQPGTSRVHRAPAGLKLIVIMIITVLVFSGNPQLLCGATAFVFAAVIIARVRLEALLRILRIIVFYGFFIAAVRIIGKDTSTYMYELAQTGYYLWKLSVVFLAGMTFFETTSGIAIHFVLTDIRNTTIRIIPAATRLPDFPRSFSLMLLFIPRIFETWAELSRSWDSRQGIPKRSIRAAAYKLTTLLPLLVIALLDVAATTDKAVRNRSV